MKIKDQILKVNGKQYTVEYHGISNISVDTVSYDFIINGKFSCLYMDKDEVIAVATALCPVTSFNFKSAKSFLSAYIRDDVAQAVYYLGLIESEEAYADETYQIAFQKGENTIKKASLNGRKLNCNIVKPKPKQKQLF